ncbi:hypothetical protein D9615_003619 [Tricholomella constricta]|uniref:Uncharacterized protein n=1 Tax=Tricholomella constricta TaxID=117010 RepID=A0A8H5HHW2_9AGAR|nr:hypothetical protein D9615_003619 [Tricholomella constricta]
MWNLSESLSALATTMSSSTYNDPSLHPSTPTNPRGTVRGDLTHPWCAAARETCVHAQPAPARTLHRKRSSNDLRYVFYHGSENHQTLHAVIQHMQDGKTVQTIAMH